jgi:hypothetical protein
MPEKFHLSAAQAMSVLLAAKQAPGKYNATVEGYSNTV